MDIHIRLTRRGDFSIQIYRQILEAVLDGRFRPGERLPATRDLARRLGLSRNTVAVAYERLVAEGVLVGRVGAGSLVSLDPSAARVSRRTRFRARQALGPRDPSSGLSTRRPSTGCQFPR